MFHLRFPLADEHKKLPTGKSLCLQGRGQSPSRVTGGNSLGVPHCPQLRFLIESGQGHIDLLAQLSRGVC